MLEKKTYNIGLEVVLFSKAEQRILELTKDGLPHYKKELAQCIDAEGLVTDTDLWTAVHRLRLKLAPYGQEILAQSFGRGAKYRRIRHLWSKDLDAVALAQDMEASAAMVGT